MNGAAAPLPRWADVALIPLANVALALAVAGLLVLAIGENPVLVVRIMITGAFGDSEGVGYTLYYTTNFIFTGLAVAVTFHAGLFNIGGEGQATLGGLGVGLVLLAGDRYLPAAALFPLALLGATTFGAAWALIPAYLQAYRGSHIVITTIMFNFLAAALLVYLMVNVLIAPGSMSPESREFAPQASLLTIDELLAPLGISVVQTPLNLSIVLAATLCVVVWLLLWHTAFGFELRTVGHSPTAANYAGVRPRRIVILAMLLSGAIAGCVGINEIMGVQHRLLLNFAAGYGFTGIAVALMGRNHPGGIVLASLLFGALNQGGTELALAVPGITRDVIVVIQGLVILFSGALSELNRPWLEHLFRRLSPATPSLSTG